MDLRAVAMGVGFALIWASAFTATRVVAIAFPPLTALVIRFAVSGVVGMALARAMGQSWHLSRADWKALIIFGICQNGLYLGFAWYAMQTVEASAAAIIASAMPLVVAVMGWAAFRDRPRPKAILGLVLGFAGVALTMGVRITAGLDPFGALLCVFGVIALSLATLSVRGASGRNLFMVVGLQMLVGAAFLLIPAIVLERGLPITVTPAVIVGIGYSILMPGLFATWLWIALVQRIGTVRAATYHFLSPIFGVAIAAAWLHEPFGISDVAGAAIVALGILMVQRARVAEIAGHQATPPGPRTLPGHSSG